MRLDEERGPATIAAALAAGVTVFDTARAHGDSERLLARALAAQPAARIVTKGGMRRPEGAGCRTAGASAAHRQMAEALGAHHVSGAGSPAASGS